MNRLTLSCLHDELWIDLGKFPAAKAAGEYGGKKMMGSDWLHSRDGRQRRAVRIP